MHRGLDLSRIPRTAGESLAFETRQEIVIVRLKEMPAQQWGVVVALVLVQFWSVCETPVQSHFLLSFPAWPRVPFVLDKALKITPRKAKLETSLLGEDFL